MRAKATVLQFTSAPWSNAEIADTDPVSQLPGEPVDNRFAQHRRSRHSWRSDMKYGMVRTVPLAERVLDALHSELRRGRWASELPSERHLSAELGISRPTLRTALHLLAAEGVIQLRTGLPSLILGRPRRIGVPKRNREIALLYNARTKPDLTSIAPLLVMLQQKLHQLGFGLRLIDAGRPASAGPGDGLAAIDAEYKPWFYLLASVPTSVQQWVSSRRLPGLIIGTAARGVRIPYIDIDQELCVAHAVSFLARRGHHRIGFLQLPSSSTGAFLGTRAFERACASLALRGVEGVLQLTAARPDAIEGAVHKMMRRPSPPTAIIFADLEMGLGLYTTLASMGLHVPRHVSVVSIGHWPLLDYLRPKPTCYFFPWETLVARIMQQLDSYLRLGAPPQKSWRIVPELRLGDSVAGEATGPS